MLVATCCTWGCLLVWNVDLLVFGGVLLGL